MVINSVLVAAAGIVFAAFWFVGSWARLRHIPGPFSASITNLRRLGWAYTARYHEIQRALHEKYGKIVRLGPNCVSIGDAREISKIHGTAASFPKSDFYRVFQPMVHGKIVAGVFNSLDEGLHRALRRPIAGIYSMSNLVDFERYVDTTINVLLEQLDRRYGNGEDAICDMGTWLQYFAFDVMGEITFSRRLGFLDQGTDVEGIIHQIWKVNEYGACVGQMPWLDRIWAKNPLVHSLFPPKGSPIVAFAVARGMERRAAIKDAKEDGEEAYNSRDFMSRFIEARAKDPANIPESYITAWATSNMQAGSDTTAIFLRAVVYYLLQNPECERKLLAELVRARKAGRLSDVVTWKESRDLPYLDACIKEAGRMHPAAGFALERVVPRGGVELCGKFIAEGTVVGINAWVAHRDRAVFGEDADVFNPDRWLGDAGRRVSMERCLLTFGAGHRTCIGKNISYLEMYKLIPTLFMKYQMTLQSEWTIENHWLAVQKNLLVKLRKREDWDVVA